MNKNQLEYILLILFKQNREDNERQEATNEYFNIMHPDSYPPILDSGTSLQLDILKPLLSENLLDWIEYFLYEAENFYPNCPIEIEGKEIIVSSDTAAIQFILNHIYKNENDVG